MYALHRDDCKLNNLPSNLRWGTPGDNLNDQKKNGKFGWHGVKKLSVECVREIDARLTAGVDYALIAEEFGITKSYVNAIARGAYYAAVTGRSSEDINPDRRRGEVFGTLNREMVMEITMMLDAGLPQKLIAKRAGVTPQNVSSINRGELWSWLTGRSPETARRPLKKGEFARQAGDRL
jgi:predicted XRE-type DNA-binding protein